MNIPTPSEIKAMRKRYAQPRKIKEWNVWHCGIVVFTNTYPAICETFIKDNQLKNAIKKPVYETH